MSINDNIKKDSRGRKEGKIRFSFSINLPPGIVRANGVSFMLYMQLHLQQHIQKYNTAFPFFYIIFWKETAIKGKS